MRRGAGHQADPLSTGRPDVLQRFTVEDSSEPFLVERSADREVRSAAPYGPCRGSSDDVARVGTSDRLASRCIRTDQRPVIDCTQLCSNLYHTERHAPSIQVFDY